MRPERTRQIVADQAFAAVEALADDDSPFLLVREGLEMPKRGASRAEWADWLRLVAEVIECAGDVDAPDEERAAVINIETRLPLAPLVGGGRLAPATRKEVDDLDRLDRLAAEAGAVFVGSMTPDERRALSAGLSLLPGGERP